MLRRQLGVSRYQRILREVFRIRRDPDTERSWTPTQELVCRCPFKAVVTTNYDPGIADARMRVRRRASCTEFASWTDELALDRWRTAKCTESRNCRCCSPMATTTSLTRWCWPPPSTAERTGGNCRMC
jgi:hypothetical protein